MKNLILSEIWIYPIKSLGGIRLRSAKVQEKGLQYDRRWMLVDANGTFMTQRVYPLMALFKLEQKHDIFQITFHQQGSQQFPSIRFDATVAPSGSTFDAVIWNDTVKVVEVSPEISKWFTQHLGISCRLVSFPENNPRPVDAQYRVNGEHVGLADAYPFLIIGQSTLNDLNSRMQTPLPMNRFRPNFVFTGGDPFEEDHWRNFTIGKNRFVAVKPCARCVLTTVNQDTAEKGMEPLITLATYRKEGNKILFGQNVVATDHTEVHEGDKIVLN
jgi:uncharacterized protein